eukprot:1159381-Pelagomonas_calceolata.AAC.20
MEGAAQGGMIVCERDVAMRAAEAWSSMQSSSEAEQTTETTLQVSRSWSASQSAHSSHEAQQLKSFHVGACQDSCNCVYSSASSSVNNLCTGHSICSCFHMRIKACTSTRAHIQTHTLIWSCANCLWIPCCPVQQQQTPRDGQLQQDLSPSPASAVLSSPPDEVKLKAPAFSRASPCSEPLYLLQPPLPAVACSPKPALRALKRSSFIPSHPSGPRMQPRAAEGRWTLSDMCCTTLSRSRMPMPGWGDMCCCTHQLMGFQAGGRQFTCSCMTHSRQQQQRGSRGGHVQQNSAGYPADINVRLHESS